MRLVLLVLLVAAFPVRAQAQLVPMLGADDREGFSTGLGYHVPLTRAVDRDVYARVAFALRPSVDVTGLSHELGLRLGGDAIGRAELSGLGLVPYGKLGSIAEFTGATRDGLGLGVTYGGGVEVRRVWAEVGGSLHSATSQLRVAIGVRL